MFNHQSKFSFKFIGLVLVAFLCLNILLVHDEWFQLFNNFSRPSFDGIKSNEPSPAGGAGQPLTKRQQQYGGLYFNAMVDLDELFAVDAQSIDQINEQWIKPELARIQQIQQILNDYAQGISQYSTASLNPLNSYLLVKKLIRQWEEIQSLSSGDADNKLAKFMAEKFTVARQTNLVKYPDYEDLMAAAVAILRFQETYEISTAELISEYGGVENLIADSDEVMKAQGNLLALGAEECFEIGLLAYRLEHHFYTAEWMQAALNRFATSLEASLDLELKILEMLAYAFSQQRNFHGALDVAKKLAKLVPSNHSSAEQWQKNLLLYRKAAAESTKEYGDKFEAKNLNQMKKKPQSEEEKLRDERWEQYKQLCRGQFLVQSAKNASKLKCYLKQDKPFLKLAPLKVEIIHLKPLLAFFRGVISDNEIEAVKQLAIPQLSRATVLNMKGQSVYASYRITKTMWLGDEDHPVAHRLNKRIEDMTNLDVETAFKLKVFKYGIGGHYDPHYDLALLNDQGKDPLDMDAKLGDRVATCLFYLSQPEKGGLTIFTELGLGIAPSVNDALFWYNLHRDGQGDLRTKHAACPVLKGDKWIFTKLINERGQEWKRPCPKKREEKGEEFVGDLAGA